MHFCATIREKQTKDHQSRCNGNANESNGNSIRLHETYVDLVINDKNAIMWIKYNG